MIVVPWNVRELTLACLRSVERRAADEGIAIELIVVDNASNDGTVAAVRREFPQATLVANPANLGFPLANNQGLTRARGRYVLFLNPDTEPGPGTLRACLDELEGNADVGMVGCRLDYPDGTVQLESGRRDYRLRHLVTELFYLHVLFPRSGVFNHLLMGDWDHRDRRDVEVILGAFMMVRRDVALAVGGLPAEVFMYHEDIAFCLRVRRLGWRIRFLGDVATLHHVNRSSRKSNARLSLLDGEWRVRIIRERQGPGHAAVARSLFGLRAAMRLGVSLLLKPLALSDRVRARFARVLDTRAHWLQLLWSVSPALVDDEMPRPPAVIPADARVPASPPAVAPRD